MREAVVVSAVRTAVGKAPKGTLKNTRPDEMGAAVIEEAVRRAEGLEKSEIEDVVMGCAMPEAEQGMNVARAAAIRAGLPVESSAMTINRFCSSGLQSIALPSHQRAARAQDEGKFDDEIVPLAVRFEDLDAKGKKTTREVTFDKDE